LHLYGYGTYIPKNVLKGQNALGAFTTKETTNVVYCLVSPSQRSIGHYFNLTPRPLNNTTYITIYLPLNPYFYGWAIHNPINIEMGKKVQYPNNTKMW
jgi:hypothetical protein